MGCTSSPSYPDPVCGFELYHRTVPTHYTTLLRFLPLNSVGHPLFIFLSPLVVFFCGGNFSAGDSLHTVKGVVCPQILTMHSIRVMKICAQFQMMDALGLLSVQI